MLIRFSLTALILATSWSAAAAQTPRGEDLTLPQCMVRLEDEAKLSAEEAGVLINLAVKEGSLVRAGQLLGNVDDRQAKLQKDAAKAGWDAATERFKSEIEVVYAQAAALVAKAEYNRMLEANKNVDNAVTLTELEKARLQWRTTELQIEKAKHDKGLAYFDVGSKKAEYDLADLGIERRAIKAPFDGVVDTLLRHQSEWLNPGDPILHIMRLDVMRVEKFVEQSKYDPQELNDCEVAVEVELAHQRKATFPGRIVFVSPSLDLNGRYLVRAEVTNRQEAGQWVLRPNHQPKMTIHLGTARPHTVEVGRRDSK